jgi:hypothetical protein
VRDAARFAARLPMACAGLTTAGDIDRVKTLARTGQSTSGGTRLVAGWSDNNMVTVTVACLSNSAGTYVGRYEDVTNIPYVTVATSIPFTWTAGRLLGQNSITVRASARQPWTQ